MKCFVPFGFFILLMSLSMPTWGSDNQAILSPEGPIGQGFGLQIKEWRASSEDLDDVKSMGVQFLRFGYPWSTVESTKGVYDWSQADFFMRKMNNRNFYALYEVGGFNGAYSPMIDTLPNEPTGQGQQMPAAPTSPEALAAMEGYVAETVRRYHGDHVIWEIWNEPDLNSNWPPEVNANDFARVISITCRTIKRVDPQAIVTGPALAYLPARNDNGHESFLATILKSPAGACLDAVTIHPYRHRDQPPETVIKDYQDIRAYIAKNTLPGNKVLPIISSEWGYSLAEVTPEQQAAYVIRSFVVNRLSGIPISIWYEYQDSFEDKETEIGKMDRESHFGIHDYSDDDKLSAKVVKAIIPNLLDARVEKRMTLSDNKIYALLLKRESGQHELLFWLADKANKNPSGLEISDGGQKKTYPIGIIPTLVCTGDAPAASLIPGEAHDEQKYYVPCPQ